jgi:hypothetical protein
VVPAPHPAGQTPPGPFADPGLANPQALRRNPVMSRRRRPPGRWVVLSVTLSPYHKRTKPAQYRHHQKAAQCPGRAEHC